MTVYRKLSRPTKTFGHSLQSMNCFSGIAMFSALGETKLSSYNDCVSSIFVSNQAGFIGKNQLRTTTDRLRAFCLEISVFACAGQRAELANSGVTRTQWERSHC